MRLEDLMLAGGCAAMITFVVLTAMAYRHEIPRILGKLADRVQGLAEWVFQFRPRPFLIALFLLALLWTLLDWRMYRDGYFFLLLMAGVVIGFAALWVREFLFLMAARDDDLPGRFDKPIWAIILIALPPLGLYLFRSYRLIHWPAPEPKPRMAPAARELA